MTPVSHEKVQGHDEVGAGRVAALELQVRSEQVTVARMARQLRKLREKRFELVRTLDGVRSAPPLVIAALVPRGADSVAVVNLVSATVSALPLEVVEVAGVRVLSAYPHVVVCPCATCRRLVREGLRAVGVDLAVTGVQSCPRCGMQRCQAAQMHTVACGPVTVVGDKR